MILRIGRWGQDIEVDSPVAWKDSSTAEGQGVTISGDLVFAALADMQVARSELLAQVGMLVAMTWSVDGTRDGYYELIDANLELLSLTATGSLATFSANLRRIGGVAQTELQSLITGTVLVNDHGVIDTEAKPFHAPSVGALVYDAAPGTPTARQRTTEDGVITWFDGVSFDADPTWSAEPSDYYKGAAEIWVAGELRAGLDAPNDVDDFMLTNGLVRATPGGGGTSNGRILVAHYDGTIWDTAKEYAIWWNATTVIPGWHYLTIIRNDPECCIIRLIRDAAENPPTAYRHVLDLQLRRGSRFVECFYTWTGAAVATRVRREAAEAATATSAAAPFTSAVGIRATANDVSGNRYVLGTARTHSQDLTTGWIQNAASNTMDFFIGSAVGGSGAATGDTPEDLCLQYLGHLAEKVRAVRR